MSTHDPDDKTSLSAEERELLAYLFEEEGIEVDSAGEIRPREDRDQMPLSFAQERLWFLSQFQPASPLYNISLAVRFKGRLSLDSLEKTLCELVRRHEILRTAFPTEGGRPQQVISPPGPVALPLIDLSAMTAPLREHAARQLASGQASRPFDLGRGPLFRVTLVRRGDEDHEVLFTIHHIIADGWSTGVLVREVGLLYQSFSEQRPSPLPELPIQYADFAHWQRQWFKGERLEAELTYWKSHLTGAASILNLPTDHPRPPVQSYRGANESFTISRDCADGLNRLSQRLGCTPFMTLLAAFDALLYRYTGQEDISVGTPVAGRGRPELEGLIGLFLNTLVLRSDLSGDPGFKDLLNRVRAVTVEAFAHQDLPFEKIVDELQPERDLSRPPLFQVLFVFQNTPAAELELPELALNAKDVESGTAKFDLLLSMAETRQGFSGSLEYATDLFEAETIGRMIRHYQSLLQAAVADPDLRISDLPLLSPQERSQLLVEWNDTFKKYDLSIRLHELFERQAARTPDAVALAFEQERLTYRQLNGRANRLARHLRGLGVGPDTLVGICMQRSVEMVVGMIAALKAGGAYLPLDPSYPPQRLSFMVEDAGVGIILTHAGAQDVLQGAASKIISVDREWPEVATQDATDLQSAAEADNLAYVIYTSGSTGKPKAAMITHGGICNRLLWMQDRYQLSEADCVLQKTPFSFDVSVWEFFWPLITGARLAIARPGGHQDSSYIVGAVHQHAVTVMHFVPSMLRVFLQHEGAERCQSLRLIISSGEALSSELQERFFEVSRAELHNLYGPTEASVDVSSWMCVGGSDDRPVPIGRPISNINLYVLDTHLNPAPIGVAGELHIAGAGLGRGYLRRPDTTAEKFTPHPFSAEPGARMYKTGDLCRYRRDGSIEYIGRIDHQVKVRGHRIELGEIEAALCDLPSIEDAVVMAREDGAGDKRLVAYVVGRGDARPTPDRLRVSLKSRLPEYMIPTAFVALDRMPLSPNGKVNRRALPSPDGARPDLEQPYVAPRTPAEEVLCAIWAEVLEVDRVGVHDNFFALGGDSIRSVRVLALARERGLSFTLQQLFRSQTVSELAGDVESAPGISPRMTRTEPFSLVSAQDRAELPADIEDAYPLAMLQAGMIYHMQITPDAPFYHNVNSIHLRARFDADALRAALQWAVARHPILRTSIDLSTYSEPLQLVHKDAVFPVTVHDICDLPYAEQERVIDAFIEDETRRRFDLTAPPLMKFDIHRRSPDTFQLTLTESHAISDGWSLHSTLAEVFNRYFASLNDEPTPDEPPPSISYRDFVQMERAAMQSDDSRRFWGRKLEGAAVLELPRRPDRARAALPPRLRTRDVPIPAELSEGLIRLARSLAVPVKSVLLVAHTKVLSAISGQDDVLTGLVFNGRPEEADGERVRGLFLNMLPFRLKLTGGRWIDLIRQAFEAEWEMLPHRRYPLAALQKNRGGRPLFETGFNYVHFHVVDGLLRSGSVEVLGFKKVEEGNTKLSAGFSMGLLTSRLGLELTYDLNDLSEEQVERIAGYYANVLASMTADPQGRHESACVLSARERQAVLDEWNRTGRSYPAGQTIPLMFEAQARRTPDAVAAIYEEQALTYGELNERANRLAHYLAALGVGPDVLACICVERSMEMVVGLLGIQKAGGAYVPLDPEYPKERLDYMLKDANAPVLLTQQKFAGSFAGHQAKVICLDSDRELISAQSVEATARRPAEGNLAYVIYTSGSTGRPKGAMNTHGAICNRLLWMQDAYGLTAEDAVLQKTPFSFDVSVWEFFWPLVTGARLVIARPGGHQDPSYLAGIISEQSVTTVHFVPSMLGVFLQESGLEDCAALKRVICSGEALSPELKDSFLANSGRVELNNLYGPTEAAVDVTFWNCADETWDRIVPIGRPIANTQIYLLDSRPEPVPLGTPGELHIGGAGLARGYLNQPALTAEKFMPDPFGPRPGARLYKTGDLARYLPDGNIEFLGRIDFQVKIRGLRIEPGEIEATLTTYPSVREAAVVAREDEQGGARLVAYVTLRQDKPLDVSDLRNFLVNKIPEYMVPSTFVALDRLPLSPNGKLDRKALPAPDRARPSLDRAAVLPRTPVERELAEIWKELLRIDEVGIYDNFFELGGHSLLLTQVAVRIRKHFQVDLSLRKLFDMATIADMTVAIAERQLELEQGEDIRLMLEELKGFSPEEIKAMLEAEEAGS